MLDYNSNKIIYLNTNCAYEVFRGIKPDIFSIFDRISLIIKRNIILDHWFYIPYYLTFWNIFNFGYYIFFK